MNGEAILLANLAATVFLTGLAWFLQIVHLPLLLQTSPSSFPEYIRRQRRRNTMVMVVPMTVELLATAWMWRVYAATALEIVILVTTFGFYMPSHIRLTRGYDEAGIRRLIALNWIRTLSWTGRAAILWWTTSRQLHI